MNSLQQITDAWGKWMASQRGTSCRFTESTNYGSQGDLGQYHQYQCSAAVQSISYDGNSPPTGGASVAYELWYDNGTTLQQSETFAYSATTQQSFTWSITESLSIGIEVSATEGVPNVASSTQKITVNLSLSSTQGATSTNAQTWTVNTPVAVPPDSSVKCDMVINSQSYAINFTEDVLVTGSVAIWFNDKVALNPNDYHWLWFIPIGNVFNDVINNNLISTEGYSVTSYNQIAATVQGQFTGSQGISVGVTATQQPLRSNKSVAAVAGGGKKVNYYPKVAAGT